jgi:CHAT domain-containing protein
MSLWQVGDDATKDLMNLFYQGLRKGMGRSQAMRTAQQTMFKGKNKHPFYWAAFILSGEWTPLSVKKKF